MGATDWVITLILGGILGMIGQGIRVIAGLKKSMIRPPLRGRVLALFFKAISYS